jgi:hypothetical protein
MPGAACRCETPIQKALPRIRSVDVTTFSVIDRVTFEKCVPVPRAGQIHIRSNSPKHIEMDFLYRVSGRVSSYFHVPKQCDM